MDVKNKKVIITGAAGGIGKELTRQLLEKGAIVFGLDINKDHLELLKEEMNSTNLKTYVVDISSKESILNFKEEYLKDNELDILINNAGIVQPFTKIKDLPDEIIERVMNINFYGPLRLTKCFLENLISRDEAFIVNISSMGGFFPFPSQTIYGASKSALKLFTEGLYSELMDTNVHVMVVMPGAINTDILKNSNVEMFETSRKSYKMTSPEETAREIVNGIEKNKFQLYIGSDSKFMNFIYKLNPKGAIKFINKKMK